MMRRLRVYTYRSTTYHMRRTYSLEELDAMRRAIHCLMVFGEGWNPHNPYDLARVVEERLRTHMLNGDDARILNDHAHARLGPDQ